MPAVPMPDPGASAAPLPGPVPDPTPVPPASPNAPSVDLFAAALGQTLCDKFRECGFDDRTTEMLCGMLEKAVQDEIAAQGGRCAYEPSAGQRCLEAIRQLDCDATAANGDMFDWLLAASSLAECTTAYRCP
jgi:hypothetical protein